MSTPDPEHIDAVALDLDAIERGAKRELARHPNDRVSPPHPRTTLALVAEVRHLREQLTDAAMLDALTRHGVLTEDTKFVCGYCGTDQGAMHSRECEFSRGARANAREQRRLVTVWEVAP